MPSISSDARFLGVDLRALWQEIRQPWRRLHESKALSWLTPDVPVLLLQADGGESVWTAQSLQPLEKRPSKVRFKAVELPEENVLRRTLSMPSMHSTDIANAVALEVQAASPFSAADLVWGYQSYPGQGGMLQVQTVLASRRQIAQYLAGQAGRLAAQEVPEVWVRTQARTPIVLSGYGEGLRERYAVRWRWFGAGLVFLVAVLVVAVAVAPTAQLRLRAIEAVHAYDALAQRVTPIVRQREALLQSAEQLSSMAEVMQGRIEPLRILDMLTRVLPDDTSLQSFKLQGNKVNILGATANASALMQLLGEQPGLRDVRAPAAAVRNGGTNKEQFAIEFLLDPQVFGVASQVASAAQKDAPAAAMPAPSAAASVPAAAAPSVAPEPLQPGKPGPSFGVSRPKPRASQPTP